MLSRYPISPNSSTWRSLDNFLDPTYPSTPRPHHSIITTSSQFLHLFPGAVFHNEDKRATSLRIYCPCLYFECLENTFSDPQVFKRLETSPESLIQSMLEKLTRRFKKSYPWSFGKGRSLPNAYTSYPRGRNSSGQAAPSSASTRLLSDPCWIVPRNSSTSSFLRPSHTTWPKVTCSTSFSFWNEGILTPSQLHTFTTKI